MMTHQEALTILFDNPPPGITEEKVREAFSRKVKLVHPDLNPSSLQSAQELTMLLQARDLLKDSSREYKEYGWQAERRAKQGDPGQERSRYGSAGRGETRAGGSSAGGSRYGASSAAQAESSAGKADYGNARDGKFGYGKSAQAESSFRSSSPGKSPAVEAFREGKWTARSGGRGAASEHASSRTKGSSSQLLPRRQIRFGHFLYYRGYLDFTQLVECLLLQREEAKKSIRRPLGQLALSRGYLTLQELARLAREHRLHNQAFKD